MLEEFGYKGRFWYNNKNKIASLLIPKNATSSIKSVFNSNNQSARYYDDITNSGFKKIVIIRNPLDKFISGYLEIIKRRKPRIKKLEFWSGDDGNRFERFITEIEKNGFIDEHVQLQHYAMTDESGIMYKFDYILLLENIDEDWSNMCEKLNLNLNLIYTNKGDDGKKKELLDIINNNELLKSRIDILLEKDWKIYNKIIKDRNE